MLVRIFFVKVYIHLLRHSVQKSAQTDRKYESAISYRNNSHISDLRSEKDVEEMYRRIF